MERFTAADGVEIAYYTWGTAGGALPPVLLHHGFTANAALNWVQPGIVPALTSAGRYVVALDARGHGASGKPHDPSFYGEGQMARDLRQLFDIVGAKQVDLVGYSMGATVSLITASQDERVRRLVVGGVGAGVVELGGVDTGAATREARVAALRASDPESITDPILRSFRRVADEIGGDREALAAQAATRLASPIALSQITAPTLLIVGDADELAARPEVLASAIPNARLLRLQGDHIGVVLGPGFASAIVEFLAS